MQKILEDRFSTQFFRAPFLCVRSSMNTVASIVTVPAAGSVPVCAQFDVMYMFQALPETLAPFSEVKDRMKSVNGNIFYNPISVV